MFAFLVSSSLLMQKKRVFVILIKFYTTVKILRATAEKTELRKQRESMGHLSLRVLFRL